jgi:hypothetical protein
MDLEQLGKVAAIASGVGAMVGGLISWAVTWWWKVRELRDSILVRYGSIRYEERPGFAMHVIGRRSHQMVLADYGFVLCDGRLVSLPMHWEEMSGESSEDATLGSTTFNVLNDSYGVWVSLKDDGIVGAYARTTTQRRVTIDFRSWDSPSWRMRLKVRMRLRWMPHEFW